MGNQSSCGLLQWFHQLWCRVRYAEYWKYFNPWWVLIAFLISFTMGKIQKQVTSQKTQEPIQQQQKQECSPPSPTSPSSSRE
jgi:hypothetical protein